MLISAVVSLIIALRIRKAALATDSNALLGDSIHFMADVASNVGVLVALVIVKLTGWSVLDPVLGVLVGVIILQSSFKLISNSFHDLMDTELPEDVQGKIKAIVETHKDMLLEYHNLRTRRSGSHKLIDLHLTTCRQKTLEEVHYLVDHIEKEIQEIIDNSNVLIHADPCLPKHCPTNEECLMAHIQFEKRIEAQHQNKK